MLIWVARKLRSHRSLDGRAFIALLGATFASYIKLSRFARFVFLGEVERRERMGGVCPPLRWMARVGRCGLSSALLVCRRGRGVWRGLLVCLAPAVFPLPAARWVALLAGGVPSVAYVGRYASLNSIQAVRRPPAFRRFSCSSLARLLVAKRRPLAFPRGLFLSLCYLQL